MKNGDSDCGVKMESEEEEDFEEIIDDDIEEAEVEANDGDTNAKTEKEGDFPGLGRSATMGTLEQPIVKFYFTAPCPEQGLDKVIPFLFVVSSQRLRLDYIVFVGERAKEHFRLTRIPVRREILCLQPLWKGIHLDG